MLSASPRANEQKQQSIPRQNYSTNNHAKLLPLLGQTEGCRNLTLGSGPSIHNQIYWSLHSQICEPRLIAEIPEYPSYIHL